MTGRLTLMPSSFVADWLPRVAAHCQPAPSGARSPRALDLAMGHGRHLPLLAGAGFRPFGVDLSMAAVRDAVSRAAASGVRVAAFCADMTVHPLPARWFDLVLVTRYLDRARMPALADAVAPGGFVIYETFTRHQLRLGRGPTSPAHLLEQGELASCFSDHALLFYEEVAEPEALARLVVRRRA